MKIRSLLLGSVAAAGLATSGYAADLGVVTSLDVCDGLGLTGLTISSADNCLQISGAVMFDYKIGDYDPALAYASYAFSPAAKNQYTVANPDGALDSGIDIDLWLQFVATADSAFGPASATIKLVSNDNTGSAPGTIGVKQAWVGIGDTTMIMAGYKDSIFNTGDDKPLDYLGLFNSTAINTGVGFSKAGAYDAGGTYTGIGALAGTGGAVMQVVANVGNGLSIGGGLENLASTGNPTAVGTINYAGDNITAHASGAVDLAANWRFHTGFTGTWDPITVTAALSGNNDANLVGGMYLDALGSVKATFDMFTLAASGEATNQGEYGVSGSATAAVSDGVTVNVGGRYFTGVAGPGTFAVYQIQAGVSAAVTDTVTLTADVGATDSTAPASAGPVIYGDAGLAWAPGGGFTASVVGSVNSLGAYKAEFKAAKTIK